MCIKLFRLYEKHQHLRDIHRCSKDALRFSRGSYLVQVLPVFPSNFTFFQVLAVVVNEIEDFSENFQLEAHQVDNSKGSKTVRKKFPTLERSVSPLEIMKTEA